MPAMNRGWFMDHRRPHRGHGPLLQRQQFIDGGLQVG